MKNWKEMKILVVEDDVEMLKVLCDLIRSKGPEVFSATDGLKALEILADKKVDLVLSDVQMPVMKGTELLKNIRSKDPHVPIVLLATGEAQVKEEEVIAMGGAGLIYKPFKFATLIKTLEQICLSAPTL